MKKLLSILFLLLLAACSSVKGRDVDYRNQIHADKSQATTLVESHREWVDAVFAVKKAADSNWAFGSCVGIGYDSKANETYLATAYHIIDGNVHWVQQTDGEGQLLQIVRTYNHPTRDIGFLVVKGRLPIVSVYKGVPSSDFDVTLGYIQGEFKNKGALAGRAVPGQSGGGVFSNTAGLFGVVSTTGEAVAIWPALVDLKLEHVVGIN